MKAKTTVIIFLAIVLTSCTSEPKLLDQDFDNKSKTIKAFATALLSGDAEGAKLLSDPGQWNKIDEWLKTHDPVSCKAEGENTAYLISPELSGGSWFISGRLDEQSGEWLVDVVYECQIESVSYCFERKRAIHIHAQLCASEKHCPTPRAPDGWESPRFQAVCVAGSGFRQNGVVSSHPPAGNAHRWVVGVLT